MVGELIALGVPENPRRLVMDRCDCPRCPASCHEPCHRQSRWEIEVPHKERWVALVTHCVPRIVAELSDGDRVRGWVKGWRTHREMVLRGLRVFPGQRRGRPGLKGALALALPVGQRAEFQRRADEWADSFVCGYSESDALTQAVPSFRCHSSTDRSQQYHVTCHGPTSPSRIVCVGTPGNAKGIKEDPAEQFTFPEGVPFPKVRWDYPSVIDDQDVMRPVLTWP